jgi:aspartate carbamoyltransferase catalytic subunit
MQLSTRHLLGIKDLTAQDIQLILDTAGQFKEVLQRPIKKVPSLRDVTIVNLFYENSTRTRISFELAEKRLSADTINFTASGSSAAKGETLLDTVNNILSMKVDLVVMRHSASGAPHFLAKHIPAAIVNAGDGINEHPTQALLDAFSIREKLGYSRRYYAQPGSAQQYLSVEENGSRGNRCRSAHTYSQIFTTGIWR